MVRTKKTMRVLGAFTVAGFVSLLPALFSSEAPAATVTRYPTCRVSQIDVSVGGVVMNAPYDDPTAKGTAITVAKDAISVYFYNKGVACHLVAGAPWISAVKDTTSSRAIPPKDISVSAHFIGSDLRMEVKQHQKVEALFLFGVAHPHQSRRCALSTASGILVQRYADPYATASTFLPVEIPQVCFDSGPGYDLSNTAAAWAVAK
jgi:hypothetical protein